MAWGMNLSGTKNVRSYAQARAHWAGEQPWRNELTSWRPLQDKRKKHVRLVRLDEGGGGYACVLYQTPMVTYYANGDIKLIGHSSAASHSFAWYTSPAGVNPVSANGYMYWQVDTPDGMRYYRGKDLRLTPAPTRGWQLLNNPVEETEKTLNLKRAAAVRKLLSHYDKWEQLTSRLAGDRGYLTQRTSVQALLNDPQNPKLFAKLHDSLGPAAGLRETAYALMGAYDVVIVTHDRLPRKKK